MSERESLLDRFCRYARIDTQSSATSTTYPSTEKQKDLLRVLVDDLKAAGLADAAMDEWGYVMATLPSNVPADHAAHGKVPAIGLIAHVDDADAPCLGRGEDGRDVPAAQGEDGWHAVGQQRVGHAVAAVAGGGGGWGVRWHGEVTWVRPSGRCQGGRTTTLPEARQPPRCGCA